MEWLAAGASALAIGLIAGWLIWGKELRSETAKRAAAEALAERIPELQQEIARREKQVFDTGDQLRAAESQREGVVATLASERRESEERIRLWEEAKKALVDSFSALSAEA